MSRPSFTDQGGQALVELVLAAAMMIPLMLVFYNMARLTFARLELVSLTREAAMYMIHENRSDLPDGVLSGLAKHTRLDPDQVSAKIGAAQLGSQQGELGSSQGMEAVLKKFLLGSRLDLHYRFFFSGALGAALPQGLDMTESVVFQSGAWKDMGWDEIKKMLTS